MITIVYAGILAIVYLFLTARVIWGRNTYRIGIGNGGNEEFARSVRVHGNFAEYVPFALLLLFLVDYSEYNPVIIHILGIALVVGRLLHATGLSASAGKTFGRMAGMILTFLVIATCAILLLWKFFALRLTGF